MEKSFKNVSEYNTRSCHHNVIKGHFEKTDIQLMIREKPLTSAILNPLIEEIWTFICFWVKIYMFKSTKTI